MRRVNGERSPTVADLAAGIADADSHHVRRSTAAEPASARRKRARENGCWFMPKSWGGGWTPVSAQGWLVTLVATLMVCAAVAVSERPVGFAVTTLVVLCALAVAEGKG